MISQIPGSRHGIVRYFDGPVRYSDDLVLVRGGKAVLLRGATLDGKMKYREMVGDNLSKAGWSWGCVSAIDSNGRTIWIADAHRGDGKRFVVRADEKPTEVRTTSDQAQRSTTKVL